MRCADPKCADHHVKCVEDTARRKVTDIYVRGKPRWRSIRYANGDFNFRDHPAYIEPSNWLVVSSFFAWLFGCALFIHLLL